MWLLSTDRAELYSFARNFDAVGGYAILSHTWDGNEQSFVDVRAIGERCRANGTNPRDDLKLCTKIREFCILAAERGYRWAWVDSCCIDKTSSSELSEAINSMYRWYKEAEMCYAYLADVPDGDELHKEGSAFRRSRWHTRAWTLQELIAPDFVIFLSQDWRELGNKVALAMLLQEITRVDCDVLTGDNRPAEYSVSARMSWASTRNATRVEDEAYCLMGLFGVSLPTNYGEGKAAFLRLQYEIMQRDPDMSLFAFGSPRNHADMDMFVYTPPRINLNDTRWFLLADSPRELCDSFDYLPYIKSDRGSQHYPPPRSSTNVPFGDTELPSAVVTSYGVQLRIPVASISGFTIAVLLCHHKGRHLGLFLTRDIWAKDPKRPRYFTGCNYTEPGTLARSTVDLARMCDLGDDLNNLHFNGKRVEASWSTIYVVATPSQIDSEIRNAPDLALNRDPTSRFHVPRWLIIRFINLRFEVYTDWDHETLRAIKLLHRSKGTFLLSLGSCAALRHEHNTTLPLWARVDFQPVERGDTSHNCSDHIDSWDSCSKEFGDNDRRVRLSFTSLTPQAGSPSTLVVHLELFGSIFQKMLKDANVSFPPLRDESLTAPVVSPAPVAHISSSHPHPAPPSTVRAESTPPIERPPSESDTGPATAVGLQSARDFDVRAQALLSPEYHA